MHLLVDSTGLNCAAWASGLSAPDVRPHAFLLAMECTAACLDSQTSKIALITPASGRTQSRNRPGTAARPQRSRTARLLAGLHDAIAAHVRRHRDATLDELRVWLRETHGVSVSMDLMWNTLSRLGLTLKKDLTCRPGELRRAAADGSSRAPRAVQCPASAVARGGSRRSGLPPADDVPGIGPVVALAYRTAVDVPTRFSNSKAVGAAFGLAPTQLRAAARRTVAGTGKRRSTEPRNRSSECRPRSKQFQACVMPAD